MSKLAPNLRGIDPGEGPYTKGDVAITLEKQDQVLQECLAILGK